MERVQTGIEGLDEMLFGGFLPRTANLVEGAPGTGKTTLGMQFIYNGIVKYNEPGLILTFEEFPQQYYRDAAGFGWDFPALEAEGKLRTVMTSPEFTHHDLQQVNGRIEQLVDEMGIKRVLVDSISHFERLTDDHREMRRLAYTFINALKRLGVTTVLTRENPILLGEAQNVESTLAFVVDSYILMRYVEIDSAMRKALLVLKLRGSDHAKDIRQYEITSRGLDVRSRFAGREGIMSGSPRLMRKAFEQAFGSRE